MRKKRIPPSQIGIPDVRITSNWDPDMLEMFRKNVATMGIQQPLLVAWDGKDYWIIDGLHRLQEAKANNWPAVDCIVLDVDKKGILLRNLVLNRLRGRTRASEMVQVCKSLRNDHGMSIPDIVKETGLREEYVREMMSIGACAPEIWQALDDERIGVGQAFQLSRLPNQDNAVRVLAQVITFRTPVKDLKDVVDDAIRITHLREEKPDTPQPEPTEILRNVQCKVCEESYPVTQVTGLNVCITCYGYIFDLKQRRMAEIKAYRTPAQIAAEQLVTPVTEIEPGTGEDGPGG
uniref:ParB-like N-terminal domain-containing protein n=1 Tax=viral metagenome TaxID=1070528 RepID=A0A6M3XVA9_9ZZZZ